MIIIGKTENAIPSLNQQVNVANRIGSAMVEVVTEIDVRILQCVNAGTWVAKMNMEKFVLDQNATAAVFIPFTARIFVRSGVGSSMSTMKIRNYIRNYADYEAFYLPLIYVTNDWKNSSARVTVAISA